MIVEANPQQENNFVFLSPFHSIFVIYTPGMLSERVSVSSCNEKETMCVVMYRSNRNFKTCPLPPRNPPGISLV